MQILKQCIGLKEIFEKQYISLLLLVLPAARLLDGGVLISKSIFTIELQNLVLILLSYIIDAKGVSSLPAFLFFAAF